MKTMVAKGKCQVTHASRMARPRAILVDKCLATRDKTVDFQPAVAVAVVQVRTLLQVEQAPMLLPAVQVQALLQVAGFLDQVDQASMVTMDRQMRRQ